MRLRRKWPPCVVTSVSIKHSLHIYNLSSSYLLLSFIHTLTYLNMLSQLNNQINQFVVMLIIQNVKFIIKSAKDFIV